ncbi:uncharacterized protein [Miscanthus floridulus]|uniref:uncharacterized protein n=1 Tax=Miscanthus floridulus TaxID=154761 RepID=UPI00345AB824
MDIGGTDSRRRVEAALCNLAAMGLDDWSPLSFSAHGRSRPGPRPRLPRVSPWPAALRRPRPTPRPLPRAAAPAFPACPAATQRPYNGGEERCLLRPAVPRLQSGPSAHTPPTPPLHFATSLPLAPQQQQQRPSYQARRHAPPASNSRTTAPSPDSRRQQFRLVDLRRLRSPEAAVVEVRAELGASFLSGEHAAVAARTPTPSGQLRSASRPPLSFSAHGRSRPGPRPRLPHISPWPAALRRPRPTTRPLPRAAAPAFPACPVATQRPHTGGEGRCLLRPAAPRLQSGLSAHTPPTPPLHFATSLPLAPQQQQRPSCQARRRALPTSSSRTIAPSPDSRRQQFRLVDLRRLRSPEAIVVEVRAELGASFLSGEHAAVAARTPTPSGQLRSANR